MKMTDASTKTPIARVFAVLACIGYPLISRADTIVYGNDFEGVVGLEWSSTKTSVTPVGDRRFLGDFGYESDDPNSVGSSTITLTLNSLPAHSAIQISFDLFVIRSWDGNVSDSPDIWDLNIAGGPNLLHTTFSNTEEVGNRQAYPDTFPGGDHPAGTGATEIDSLGYQEYHDSIYHLEFTTTHAASSIAYEFSGIDLQYLPDESWGLDNVTVSISPPIPEPAVAMLIGLTVPLMVMARKRRRL